MKNRELAKYLPDNVKENKIDREFIFNVKYKNT